MRIAELVALDRSALMLLVLEQEAALAATQAREAVLAALRDELAAYLAHHHERWGARADQLSVHVDYDDLCDWRDALALAASPAPDGVIGEEGSA